MRCRLVIGCAAVALSVLAWPSRSVVSQSRDASSIKIIVNQLPQSGGVVPIEIIQPAVVSSAPNKLDDFTYLLKNNSGKAVDAVAVIRTIEYEDGGKVYADSACETADAAFHPDMSGKPLIPGGQMSMGSPGPISFDQGVTIKEITLTINYVEYADHAAYGSGGEGEQRIKAMREGARRYKACLEQEYSRAGNSLTTIVPELQAATIPAALKLDSDQTMGAERYRLYLLNTFQRRGAADVESRLKPIEPH